MILTETLVKGENGCGLSLSTTIHGNGLKRHVIHEADHEKCRNIRKGDFLVEVNGFEVKNMEHEEIVQMFKNARVGQTMYIKVER